MGGAGDGRLSRLLGDPELAWLVQRVRRRLELGRGLDGTVTLADATEAQRRAVARLLGRAPREGRALTVSLVDVDDLLRRSGACPAGLAAAVVRLGGPVAVRAEVRAVEERAWADAFGGLSHAVEASARPELVAWARALRASGIVKRLAPDPRTAGDLLDRAAAVLAELPAAGEPVGRFAGRVLGNAHALDDGEPLATLVLGAARALGRLAPLAAGESVAESRREAWAAVGLLRDELSSTVLTLGVPGDGERCGDGRTGTGGILGIAREHGQPVVLTLRQVGADPPAWTSQLAKRTVYVCENPVVVAVAADRLGDRCAPLVCTGGQPGVAALALLRLLVAAGARLRHHGDFDWGGVRIGNVLHARLPVRQWRFDAAAYRQAPIAAAGPALRGQPVGASWDPCLEKAMLDSGRGIEEEAVIDDLLADLAAP